MRWIGACLFSWAPPFGHGRAASSSSSRCTVCVCVCLRVGRLWRATTGRGRSMGQGETEGGVAASNPKGIGVAVASCFHGTRVGGCSRSSPYLLCVVLLRCTLKRLVGKQQVPVCNRWVMQKHLPKNWLQLAASFSTSIQQQVRICSYVIHESLNHFDTLIATSNCWLVNVRKKLMKVVEAAIIIGTLS